jgi:hypothetical protein
MLISFHKLHKSTGYPKAQDRVREGLHQPALTSPPPPVAARLLKIVQHGLQIVGDGHVAALVRNTVAVIATAPNKLHRGGHGHTCTRQLQFRHVGKNDRAPCGWATSNVH